MSGGRLGLYDSGLGGLTVLAALRRAGIERDVVYFADQAHVPYGDRGDAELGALLAENFRLLEAYAIDAVVMACNTSCAVASRRGGFPPARFAVLDLIENAAAALATTGWQHVAVIATAATVRSGAYGRAIRRYAPQCDVLEIAAPALVPLVERGLVATPAAWAAVSALCAQLPATLDAVVYGCTHYPLLDCIFGAVLAARVARFDPALAQAAAVAAFASTHDVPPANGGTHFVTNGDVHTFEANVRRYIPAGSRATFARLAAVAAG